MTVRLSVAVPRYSSISAVLGIAGSAYLAAILLLILSKTPLGSALFFTAAAIMWIAYGAMLWRIRYAPADRRLLLAAFALAILFRIPAAVAPFDGSSDIMRYLWDGRVQGLGYNPYRVVPDDPALAHTHTADTAAMPSRRDRTPYPPGAQLFFRLVVSIRDSPIAMKLALVGCDILTLVVLRRWLIITNRNQWLATVYGWHPLVVLEVAHSGHIDALGALWITAAAYWLARRRTILASIAFVLAIATKLLPIVLAPLFAGRLRLRDVMIGAAVLLAVSMPFIYGTELSLGAMPTVVERVRFNGPVFRAVAWLTAPQAAAAIAVLLGLAGAIWARRRTSESDPAAWAWPMALALLCAPVVYPWYLLYLTPFLFTAATLPIMVWTFSVLSVYIVWDLAREGSRWVVPWPVMVLEYGLFVAATIGLFTWWSWHSRRGVSGQKQPLA
jgi:alpha-1,6-mannosyltransferase